MYAKRGVPGMRRNCVKGFRLLESPKISMRYRQTCGKSPQDSPAFPEAGAYSISAKMPAMMTEVMVTVVKPPTIIGGNIWLMR